MEPIENQSRSQDPASGSNTRDTKLEANSIRANYRFVAWWSNFWYHYKWYVIIIAFFIITFAVCFAQCASNEQNDIVIIFAGPKAFSSEENQSLISALEDCMPGDLDGNGKRVAALVPFLHYSENDLNTIYENAIAEDPSESGQVAAASYINQLRIASNSDHSNYSTTISTGDAAILILEESLFLELKKNERLEPLSNVLSNVPDTSPDGYAVRISDTGFYHNYPAAAAIPEGMFICFLRQPILGTMHDSGQYENAKQMLRAIIEQ